MTREEQVLVGVGYRPQLAGWLETRPAEVGCLEITAEHFFEGGEEHLRELARNYPLMVHGLGLSLGTPGPLDPQTLQQFARVVQQAQPQWISEHVAFTRTADVDLGHLNPVGPNRQNLEVMAEHARQISERCGRRLLLENITSHLRLDGEMSEPEFLNQLCAAAGCALLLDVTNLYINSRNHDFDARAWLRELDPRYIAQLHVVGYSFHEGRWQDSHAAAIQDDLRELIQDVLDYACVRAIILERDQNHPAPEVLADELRMLQAMAN